MLRFINLLVSVSDRVTFNNRENSIPGHGLRTILVDMQGSIILLLILSSSSSHAVFHRQKCGKKIHWITELIGVMILVAVIIIVATTTSISASSTTCTIVIGSFTTAPVADLDLGWSGRKFHEVWLSLLSDFLATKRCGRILECHKGIRLYFLLIRRIYVRGRHHLQVRMFYFFDMSHIVLILVLIRKMFRIFNLHLASTCVNRLRNLATYWCEGASSIN